MKCSFYSVTSKLILHICCLGTKAAVELLWKSNSFPITHQIEKNAKKVCKPWMICCIFRYSVHCKMFVWRFRFCCQKGSSLISILRAVCLRSTAFLEFHLIDPVNCGLCFSPLAGEEWGALDPCLGLKSCPCLGPKNLKYLPCEGQHPPFYVSVQDKWQNTHSCFT